MDMDDTWEARMAAKASARKTADDADACRRAETDRLADQQTIDEYLATMAMSPADAGRILDPASGFACSCMGCPLTLDHLNDPPCYCELNTMRARQVLGLS